MGEVTVTVENTVAAVTVVNADSAETVAITGAAEVAVTIAETGVQGPPGPGSELDPDFIIDGGNF